MLFFSNIIDVTYVYYFLLKSGTSYNNRVYLSLESLKQELESEEKAEKANQEK